MGRGRGGFGEPYVLPLGDTDTLIPKLERISPLAGLRRLFALRSLAEFAKGVLKLAAVSAVGAAVLWPAWAEDIGAFELEAGSLLARVRELALRLLVGIAVPVVLIALLDLGHQRHEHRKRLRMSRRELKEEFKQTEGDPMIESRLRALRQERARRRMMAEVPEATVVVTNPTHVAVALRYDAATMAAPKLVAKGTNTLALRIREVAQPHDVLGVENPPLARALHAAVDLDQEIPPAHYRAVAEIIGYVLRLRGPGAGRLAGARPPIRQRQAMTRAKARVSGHRLGVDRNWRGCTSFSERAGQAITLPQNGQPCPASSPGSLCRTGREARSLSKAIAADDTNTETPMSVPLSTEQRMLTADEFEVVKQTHYPDICNLSKSDLTATARRLRDYRDKARDVSRQQRREMRGKSDPRGARPARDNTGTTVKKQIFVSALRRVSKEIQRLEKDERRASQGDIARRALELKRANRVRHHPSAGRTAAGGIQANPNERPTVESDPREIGRVSQFVKAGQARRDG